MNRRQIVVLCVGIIILMVGYFIIKDIDLHVAWLIDIAGIIAAITAGLVYKFRNKTNANTVEYMSNKIDYFASYKVKEKHMVNVAKNGYTLDCWEEFEEVLNKIDIETEVLKKSDKTIGSIASVIYRGQADSNWYLESTLERKVKKNITVGSYFNLILKVWKSNICTYEKKWPDLENEIKGLNVANIHLFPTADANSYQIIGFMAHLRHHGFPSPLLDWTANPLIAAFFAFENIHNSAERIAIYTFREYTGYPSDMSNMLEPTTIEIGPNIPGIERHEKQEACYTLCVQQDDISNFRSGKFDNMEKDINKPGFYLDDDGSDINLDSVKNVTNKYTIPATERNKVLEKLKKENINRCFLFEESEDNRLSDYWNIILANGDV